jgi:glycosyltransferase 2 family protein
MRIQYNFRMRKIIVVIVLILAAALIIISLSELQNIVDTLRHSNWRFLVAALLVELIWMYNSATTYSVMFRLVGIKEKSSHLVLVATAANFVNVIAPSVGVGGMAVFLDDANRRNHSSGRVMVVGVLYILFDYLAFLCVLTLGLIVLIRRNDLNGGELTASAILLLIAAGMAFLLFLGYKSEDALDKALMWLARLVNRILRPFIHRDYLQVGRARSFAREIAEGINLLRDKKRELLWPFLFSLNNFALLLCVLAFTFLALGTPFSVGTLVGGFSIAYLFLIVSPTPSGLGVVEGAMAVALNTLRVPLGAAALITLTYRAITFWFPLAVGAVAFRILQREPKPMPVLDKTE